ncbi:hypothetical protein QWZ08_22145 [Ferruginibacter paludis]|uniref:hypothetical protein n=1 Tax=Ferruginibacter paludis TaxID=1310417 RepID=UPI0025B30747|nr:hypothetical protein [Ferruginibacter paludis]MDN3658372.1 hypothetical protein [Ferruginibacter paludis]
MKKSHSVVIAFTVPSLKLVFKELFLNKIKKPLRVQLLMKDVQSENVDKYLIYTPKWITITINEIYFENRFWKRNQKEFFDLLFSFFDFMFSTLKNVSKKNLLKVIFKSHTGKNIHFLFEETEDPNFLKSSFLLMMNKISKYRENDITTLNEIRKTFSPTAKGYFYEFLDGKWQIVHLLHNAGKYHHGEIAKNIQDKRISKPDIVVDKNYLKRAIAYPAIWCIKSNGKEIFSTRPNDISLYSNIAMNNLNRAKEIFDSEISVLWKYNQNAANDVALMNYFELIITSVIIAYSSIEALVNMAIPWDYVHKRREKNKNTNRMKTVKNTKSDIERWYTLDDKMNIILPEALNVILPNQQKWWVRFDKLKKLRNEIIHSIDSKSNDRYSKFLKKDIFGIVGSHLDVINFFSKWSSDNHHYLINKLPYGFGYDDIIPALMNSKEFEKTEKELYNIKELPK